MNKVNLEKVENYRTLLRNKVKATHEKIVEQYNERDQSGRFVSEGEITEPDHKNKEDLRLHLQVFNSLGNEIESFLSKMDHEMKSNDVNSEGEWIKLKEKEVRDYSIKLDKQL